MAKSSQKGDVEAPVVSSLCLRLATAAEIVLVLSLIVMLEGGVFVTPEGTAPAWALGSILPLFWLQLLLLMFWTYRANRYLEDQLHSGLETGPALAGLGYIIPILTLWKPYVAMREIYKASRAPDTWREDKQASIIGWWWGLWLFGALISLILKNLPDGDGIAPRDEVMYLASVLRLVLLVKFILQFLIVNRVMAWFKRGGARPGVEQIF